ncbi:hypothetical protein H6G83_21385 [Anabaena azotica FACHB-119]|uniref:Uncharacterized protein n=1 Tax=Anabaena azotica FACHB-119 TaxID=947527 RepID=A0ABR8D7K0_9NOST|nr:hypothetical protein [Anabaena azotica FACHB-119]
MNNPKIKIGSIKAEGNCFQCGKYSGLKFSGTDWLCPKCYNNVNKRS